MAGETDCVLDVAVEVVHVAEQEVAFDDDQVSTEDCPEVMVEGLAETFTVGAEVEAFTTTVAEPVPDPPAPLQVIE